MQKGKKGIENPGKVLKRLLGYVFKNYKDCAEYFMLNEQYIQQCCRGMYKLKNKYKAYYEEMA